MILLATTAQEAMLVAEKTRSLIENLLFANKSEKIKLTISLGVTSFKKGDTAQSAYERADKALYKAKHTGRNRAKLF